MRKALIPALLLVLLSVALGATVFREQVARAAGNLSVLVANDSSHPVPVHETNTDANGNIKVHEQGTASVNVMNLPAVQSTRDLNSPGQEPDSAVWISKEPGQFEISPDVPSGKIFIATYFSTQATSTTSSLTGADCSLFFDFTGGGGVFFLDLPGTLISDQSWSASAQFFVPLHPGQAITAFCDATGSGPLDTFFDGILSGYYVSAS